MKTSISIFGHLDAIADRYGVKDTLWAKRARIRRPSISELRRLLRHPSDKIGRVCTVEKVNQLINGLTGILGGETLRKEILDCIEKEKDQNIRFLLYAAVLRDASGDAKDAVESTMKIAVQTIQKE